MKIWILILNFQQSNLYTSVKKKETLKDNSGKFITCFAFFCCRL